MMFYCPVIDAECSAIYSDPYICPECMSMKYEDKKKVIEAAKVLQNFCDEIKKKQNGAHDGCPFWNKDMKDCELFMDTPNYWVIPKPTR